MRIEIVDDERRVIPGPYLIRMPGWTWERYLAEAPDTRFCEYEKGDLLVHSPADPDHQRLVRFLSFLLQFWCLEKRAGEILNGPAVLQVAPDIGREPDIFLLDPKDTATAKGKRLAVVPPLIVEIVSPSSRDLDLDEKPAEYATLGVREYWAVDRSTRKISQHVLESAAYSVEEITSGPVRSVALPGFFFRAEWLWSDPLPSELECIREILGA